MPDLIKECTMYVNDDPIGNSSVVVCFTASLTVCSDWNKWDVVLHVLLSVTLSDCAPLPSSRTVKW